MALACRAILALTLGLVLVALMGTRSVAKASELLRVVTYNVAGLPEGVSRSSPVANLPLIGEGLNRYDLALIQEDFAARALRARDRNTRRMSGASLPGAVPHRPRAVPCLFETVLASSCVASRPALSRRTRAPALGSLRRGADVPLDGATIAEVPSKKRTAK
jgi:hypothetical protein